MRLNLLIYFGYILCMFYVVIFSLKVVDLLLIFFLKEEDLIIGKNFINNEEKYGFFLE